MCGIIGILGKDEAAAPRVVEALRRLEYRGYDSSGVATLDGGKLDRRRAEGKLNNLETLLGETPLGHPWRADEDQCAPACLRPCGAGP